VPVIPGVVGFRAGGESITTPAMVADVELTTAAVSVAINAPASVSVTVTPAIIVAGS